MKILKTPSAFICLIFISMGSFAQINSNLDNSRVIDSLSHSVGLHAGLTTGIGLSYRFRPNRLGVQATFGPLKTENKTEIHTGVSFLYVLFTQKDINFFLYQGNSFMYKDEKERVYNPAIGEFEEGRKEESFFNHGLGFGVEVIGYDRVGINLMIGYGAFKNFELINLTGEAGIYIYL